VNIFDNETASFWKGPGLDPKTVKTEVFLLPAAASMEKEGSMSNSGRWVQWKYKACAPPQDALSVGDWIFRLMSKVKSLYQKEGGVYPEPVLNLKWDYADDKGMFDPLNTRWQSWLTEAQPQAYVEISEELAQIKGIKNGEMAKVESLRGSVECVAMVTTRFRPFKIGDQIIHQVGTTFNYGWLHPKDCGDSANLLTPTVGDANTMTPEYKAFMVNVSKKED